jgi:hypothetical protein
LQPIVYKRKLLLDSPSSIRDMVGPVYQQSRSSCFLYLARRLDVSGHFALGPKGSEAFVRKLQQSSKSVIHLGQGVDHLYNHRHPYQPVIFNTDCTPAPKRNGAEDSLPLLSRFRSTVMKGIHNIDTMLNLAATNKRATLSLDIGYTAVQADRWQKANNFDVAMPGFMQAMDSMP